MEFDRDKIQQLLKTKGVKNPCHRCNHNQFSLLDGYSSLGLQDNLGSGLVIGGPSVPVALVACNNCGAITSHAVGALGLLPKDETGKPSD